MNLPAKDLVNSTHERPAARTRRRERSDRAIPATVVSVLVTSPHFVRVTLHAKGFAGLHYLASDHYVRLLLPRPGQREPQLPTTDQWWPEMVAMDPAARPTLRNYTVVDVRPESSEMDIDFVRHGDGGPATRWVNRARAGDRVGIIDQGVLHEVRADATEYLLIGDETALPAAEGVVRALPLAIPVTAFLEVPGAADMRGLSDRPGVDAQYLVRRHPDDRPGALLPDAVSAWTPSSDRAVAWVAGESAMAATVRRQLVRTGLPKDDISFHGYFKHGEAQYED